MSTYFLATLCGLALGGLLGFAVGMAAGTTYSSIAGADSGAGAMQGFFFVGPFGLVAGFLLGTGIFLRLNSGPKALTTGLLWGGGVVAVLGLIAFLIPVIRSANARSPRVPFELQLEFEVAADSLKDDQDRNPFHWGYAGESSEEKANWPFYEEKCSGGYCVLTCAIFMSDNPTRRLALFAHNGRTQSFPISQSGRINAETQWAHWQSGDQVRFRWMIRKSL